MTLTEKQWRMLQCLEHHDGEGTIEVCIQFGELDSGKTLPNGEPDDGASWRLTQFVLGNIVRSLVRKGLARDDGAWGITPAGRRALLADGRHCCCGMCAMARAWDDREAAQAHPGEAPAEFLR